MPTHWNAVEVWWTLLAVAGFLAGAYNIFVSRKQLWAVMARKVSNGRRIIAIGRFTRDLNRMVIQALYVSVGVYAAHLDNEPMFGAYVLLITAVLVSLNTVTDGLERHIVARYNLRRRADD